MIASSSVRGHLRGHPTQCPSYLRIALRLFSIIIQILWEWQPLKHHLFHPWCLTFPPIHFLGVSLLRLPFLGCKLHRADILAFWVTVLSSKKSDWHMDMYICIWIVSHGYGDWVGLRLAVGRWRHRCGLHLKAWGPGELMVWTLKLSGLRYRRSQYLIVSLRAETGWSLRWSNEAEVVSFRQGKPQTFCFI